MILLAPVVQTLKPTGARLPEIQSTVVAVTFVELIMTSGVVAGESMEVEVE